jgi:hypothetical protein
MPGGRPTKPLSLVQGHRTKAEKKIRKEAEEKLLTGTSLKENEEVKNNSIAHKEFMRLRKILKAINMDDDLYSNMINTLCMLKTEKQEYEKIKLEIPAEIEEIKKMYDNGIIDALTYIDRKSKLQSKAMECDKNIMTRRKMELDISKENVMTIQSALRSIPKKEQPKQESPITAFLKRKQAGGNDT